VGRGAELGNESPILVFLDWLDGQGLPNQQGTKGRTCHRSAWLVHLWGVGSEEPDGDGFQAVTACVERIAVHDLDNAAGIERGERIW
jgi:hypothetical protein